MRTQLIAALLSASLATTLAEADTLPQFPPGSVWNQDITTAPIYADSASQIATLAGICNPPGSGSECGFGFGRFQIDLEGFRVVRAPAGAPTRTLNGYPFENYYFPDCEAIGTSMPVPLNAQIEASPGLSCPNQSEDCHLLVVQGSTLYEAYHANVDPNDPPGEIQAQCLAVWNLSLVYPPENRGEHCTSADAAGFPITPLLFNADEVFNAIQVNGDLGHAIRFILPNLRIANDPSLGGVGGRLYVRPASHAGGPVGPVGTVAYGSRLRLRPDFPLTNYNPAAQVILRTLKKYGMVLADGGNIALTAEDDVYTTHTWPELGITSRIFFDQSAGQDVTVSDFQVIDTGPRIAETFDCVRFQEPTGVLFSNGFE